MMIDRRLKPLTEFVCDHCGDLITDVSDGWVEWLQDAQGNAHNFRIVHNTQKCAQHQQRRPDECMDNHLEEFVGPAGLWHVLWMITPDRVPGGDRRRLPMVRDINQWLEVFKRLQVPGYEQARLFFDQAIEEGCLDTNREHDTDPEVIETILVKFVDQASES